MKLFKYITIAFSSLFMCGCSDYLDNAPDDTLTMEMVFNDRTRTEDWLSGVYNRIPDNYWDLLKVWGYDSMGDDLDPFGVRTRFVFVRLIFSLKMLTRCRIRGGVRLTSNG